MNFLVVLLFTSTCVLAANPRPRPPYDPDGPQFLIEYVPPGPPKKKFTESELRAKDIKQMRERPEERLYHSDRFPDRNARYDELLAAGQYDELYDQIIAWRKQEIKKQVDQVFKDMDRIRDEATRKFQEERRKKRQEEDRIRYQKMVEEEERRKAEENQCIIS